VQPADLRPILHGQHPGPPRLGSSKGLGRGSVFDRRQGVSFQASSTPGESPRTRCFGRHDHTCVHHANRTPGRQPHALGDTQEPTICGSAHALHGWRSLTVRATATPRPDVPAPSPSSAPRPLLGQAPARVAVGPVRSVYRQRSMPRPLRARKGLGQRSSHR
jgi:hypothetical protein